MFPFKNKFLAKLVFSLVMIFSLSTIKLYSQEYFWEDSLSFTTGDCRFPISIQSKNGTFVFWQEIDNAKNQIYISCRHYFSRDNFIDNKRFAGPFAYSGEVPDLYSVAISDNGTIVIPVASTNNRLSIFVSTNKGVSFSKKEIQSDSSIIAPRVYVTSKGKFRLFVSSVVDGNFKLNYLDSNDGINWSALKTFSPGGNFRNPFIPVNIKSGNGDLVVFQAQYSSSVLNRLSYQLFGSYTTDDGKTWSEPVLITNQQSLSSNIKSDFSIFQNQRAALCKFKNKIYMVWERTESINSSIWIAEISNDGIVPKTAKQITENGNASRPNLFVFKDELYLEWFDTRTGNESVYMVKFDENLDYSEYAILENDKKNLFSYPVIFKDELEQEKLSFVFQQSVNNTNSICILNPDTTVQIPKLLPITYKKGKHSLKKDVQIQVEYPYDSSGITGYSYTWGKDNQEIPPEKVQYFGNDRIINLRAEDDGIYILNVRVQDRAGNWSKNSQIEYVRDLTPPEKPELKITDVDENGFLNDNTFVITWEPSKDKDISGYNYELQFLGDIPKSMVENKTHSITLEKDELEQKVNELLEKYKDQIGKDIQLKNVIITSSPQSKQFYNKPNGVYVFRVSAIDEVGNVSTTTQQLLILNKYSPQTYVESAYQTANEIGEYELVINGGGFTYEGTISKIIIDKDGKEPFDLELSKDKGDFIVKLDKKITNVKIGTNLEQGTYRIGIYHTDRGWYWTGTILDVSSNGTVKIESEYQYRPRYKLVEKNYRFAVSVGTIILIFVCILILLILLVFFFVLMKNVKDRKLVFKEIKSLITGDYMPLLKTKDNNQGKKGSLKVKLVLFTIVLVVFVIAFVTYINGRNMINTQQQTLTSGLQNRIEVLMESLSSGVKNFLPTENDVELGQLPDQMNAVNEVKKVLIVGQKHSQEGEENLSDNIDLSYVWATSNINERAEVVPGVTVVQDTTTLEILERFKGLNQIAKDSVQQISKQITANSNEYTSLVGKNDADSIIRRRNLSLTNEQLRSELNNKLSLLADEYTNSIPSFNAEILNSDTNIYTFYKPVLYRQGNSDTYLHGAIITQVDIITLVQELNNEIKTVTISAIILASIAVILGALGSLILSSLIVRPIKKLENHLQDVGSLMTKSVRERQRLEKKHIDIKSKDEIGRLGDVVNQMTLSVGLAAYEEFLQLDGKAVQERFIPLEEGEGGRKLPIVRLNEDRLSLFAFYKGDSAVSGDYFDYKKLDENWYVFIKCDISGHGVPAALLVSVVATKFKDFYYFSNWNYQKNGINLKSFVSAVNDFIFGLGTRGKFSTINISLYNKATGELYVCNAGDNKIHIYDSYSRKLNEVTLSSTPTAGGVSTDLVEMTTGGYKVEKLVLKPGDILFLYTDGIDESERFIRDRDYSIKLENKEETKIDKQSGKEQKIIQTLERKEQFGQERITQIIESVLNKKKFVLEKEDNPNKAELLEFDFTNCKGTIDEAILALASIERVFRMFKTPKIRVNDEIEVDKVIDEFLKEHFTLYSKYCMPYVEVQESEEDMEKRKMMEDPNVIRYSYVTEDKQADDITMIAIKRN